MADDDGDTRVEVETTADNDIIRLTARGTEQMTMNGATNIISANSPLELNSSLRDVNNSTGANRQILTSTGTGVDWSGGVLVKSGLIANRNQPISTNGTATKWNCFVTEIIDTHNAFTNSIFTAPISGLYEVTTTLRINTGTSIGSLYWSRNNSTIYTNISQTIYTSDPSTQISRGVHVNDIISLNAGNTLRLRNNFGSGNTITINSGSNVVIKWISNN